MKHNVGELRPSQLITTFGVGSLVDLPHISAIVIGLDEWPVATGHAAQISEDRLLAAVRTQLGPQVDRLLAPPIPPATAGPVNPFEAEILIGVPVAPFPRWMLCPRCQLLAPVDNELFTLKPDPFHPDRTRYVHAGCQQSPKTPPPVVPARFLVACEHGHLDDFPWLEFVHRGRLDCRGVLRLVEFEPSGEARDLMVICDTCGAKRFLSDAFGQRGKLSMPLCRGRRPHLRDFDAHPCGAGQVKAILLGASNLWFSETLVALALPIRTENRLKEQVQDNWAVLQHVNESSNLEFLRNIGQINAFAGQPIQAIWGAIQEYRAERDGAVAGIDPTDLKSPEWVLFSTPASVPPNRDFQLRPVATPADFDDVIERVVLVDQLREVQALVGFTRIDAPGELSEGGDAQRGRRMRLSHQDPVWVPAAQVRGEGIFIQFREDAIRAWANQPAVQPWHDDFLASHVQWRQARRLEPPEANFPGIRYVLLHSFSHALMRRLVLECGYTAASLKERIYAREPAASDRQPEPMAGVLIYTAAPDSEGTLGGLVSLGEPEQLSRHLRAALRDALHCASDPLCAERTPSKQGLTLHAAACHACLFAPETACERGNRYLDRTVLVPTVEREDLAFFAADLHLDL